MHQADSCMQGKRLQVPERVPFRLTRDVVDGFGFAGTEGVFRRCCEQVLRVLREKKRVLLMIVDVLKYDPLQVWQVLRFRRLFADADDLSQGSASQSPPSADQRHAGACSDRGERLQPGRRHPGRRTTSRRRSRRQARRRSECRDDGQRAHRRSERSREPCLEFSWCARSFLLVELARADLSSRRVVRK